MTDLDRGMTQADFGTLIGVSRQAVGDLMSRGVLADDMTGGQMLHAYCSHLREVAAGRLAAGDLDLATERAGLAKAQRLRIEMINAEKRRELLPAILIEEVLAKAGGKVAGILDAIPGMVKRRLPTMTADDIDLIAAEVARARNIAALVSVDDLAELPDDYAEPEPEFIPEASDFAAVSVESEAV